MKLRRDEHEDLVEHARIERYGDGERMQRAGEVPSGMMFVLSGTVQMNAHLEDGSQVMAWTQDEARSSASPR